ncbi:MAG TPA: CPBP family intramembrane glutamic endopeptidase [Candidatus Aquilonibacter sp.]|nr:CPBP family intramembrane glutamic endopeptidase [Candidatus Aquilonibacter sp.]
MQIATWIMEIALVAFVIFEVVQFVPRYRRLKEEIANGDTHARTRVYRRALVFECASAALAVAALGFDWGKLNPKTLGLENLGLMRTLASGGDAVHGLVIGVIFGLAAGTIAMIVAKKKMARSAAAGASGAVAGARQPWGRKLLPDFSTLIPSTTQERLLWVPVAISAGVCEEIVFRGWLLSALHGQAGLSGVALIAVAAAIFGLAHVYQRTTGVILTAFAGAVFCVVYVATGSLLVPIVIHCAVDLRFALMPGWRARKAEASASCA